MFLIFASWLLDPKLSRIYFLAETFRKSTFILKSEYSSFIILFSQWNFFIREHQACLIATNLFPTRRHRELPNMCFVFFPGPLRSRRYAHADSV